MAKELVLGCVSKIHATKGAFFCQPLYIFHDVPNNCCHILCFTPCRDPITLDDSDDETPSAQQSAAARILALHKKTMGGKEQ